MKRFFTLKRGLGLILALNLMVVAAVAQCPADNAGNYTSWTNGSNAGTGFNPWVITAPGNTSNGGFFRGSSTDNDNGIGGLPNINTSGNAFGLYSNSDITVEAVRQISNTSGLGIGQTLSFSMDNGGINPDKVVGFSLRNDGDENLMELYFRGGQSNFEVNDAGGQTATSVGFTRGGIDVSITRTGTTSYSITILRKENNATQTLTRNFVSRTNSIPRKLRFFNFQAGSNAPFNFYFNNLSITTPAPTGALAITNSTCASGCAPSGGSISLGTLASPNSGGTLEYSTNGGTNWSGTLPTYNQTTSLTILASVLTSGCRSSTVQFNTTAGTCITPSAPTGSLNITNSSCVSNCTVTGGSIALGSVSANGGGTLEYSTNGGSNWSSTLPSYTGGLTILARVVNGSGCASGSVQVGQTVAGTCTTPVVPTINTVAPTCSAAGSSTITNYSGSLIYTFNPLGPTAGALGVISGATIGQAYQVSATNSSGCTSDFSSSFTNLAELAPIDPVGPIVGPAGVCPGATGQEFSVSAFEGATYEWTLPAGVTVTGSSTTNSISLDFSSTYVTGMVAVKAIGACNQTALSVKQVQAYNSKPGQPGFIQGKNLGVCTANEVYSIPVVGNATGYTWVVPANTSIVSGQGTTSIVLSFAIGYKSGTLSVTANNCAGTSEARTLMVRTIPGTPAAIKGPSTVCPNQTGVQFSTTPVAGVTYNWVVPAGATITSGQGTAAITVTWGTAAGNVKVQATNSCGSSGFRTKMITIGLGCTVILSAIQAEPVDEKLRVNLWPNPARDVLMITLEGFEPGKKMELTLMQADGKVQTSQSLVPSVRGQQVRMDVSRSAAGLYLLQAKQGNLTETKRVIIVR